MSLRKKKTISIMLYALYVTFITLLLIFGAKVSHWLADLVDVALNKKEITDVTVNIGEGETILAGTNRFVQYSALGDFSGDPGLRFQSLNLKNVSVSQTGVVHCNFDFDGDYLDAQIKVTSKYDRDFEKIFTFRFVKKIPNEFEAAYFVKGYAHGVKNLKVGVPVYVFSHTEQKSGYNVYTYDVVYDEEYFTKSDDGSLIPTKMTPDGVELTFKVVYYNGRSAESTKFVISEPQDDAVEFDEIRLDGLSIDKYVGTSKKYSVVTLYNKGEPIMTDYKIEYKGDPSDMEISAASHICFYSSGDKEITVTLPNGFSQTATLKIRNVISFPSISGVDNAVEVVEMDFSDVRTFNLTFNKDITYDRIIYTYDESRLSISSDARKFTVSPKKSGDAELKITINDGYTSVSRSFVIRVGESPSMLAIIAKNVAKFVAKVMGHVAMFGLLGILAMNMFKYLGIYRTVDRFVLYILTALPSAVITEFAQTFIPGRTGRVQDVLIDMAGFFLGTLAILIFRWIRDVLKRRKARYQEKTEKAFNSLRSYAKLDF